MPRRILVAVALAVATPVLPIAGSAVGAATASPIAATASPIASPIAATADTEPDGGATDGTSSIGDNPFLPEERGLGECSSSLPKPGCGSKAQGGWRQGLVFGALMLGMAFIGWRIFRAVRRADRRVPG